MDIGMLGTGGCLCRKQISFGTSNKSYHSNKPYHKVTPCLPLNVYWCPAALNCLSVGAGKKCRSQAWTNTHCLGHGHGGLKGPPSVGGLGILV